MAKFPIQQARQELGFTPATGVRANIDTRTGEGAVGAAVGQALIAGGQAIQRIQQKRQDLEDTRSSLDANSLTQTAINENIAFRNTTADTKEWSKDLQERLKGVESQIGQLGMSDDTRATTGARFQAASQEALSRSLIAETAREADDTRGAVIASLTEAARSGDPSAKMLASDAFDGAAPSLWDPAEARGIKAAAVQAGLKLGKEDTLDSWRNRIASNVIATEQVLDEELELRKDGDGVIPDLSSADIQSLLNTATNRKSQLEADAQAAINKANSELETQLHNDIVDGSASITEISKSGLPAEAQRRLERDIADVAERDVARTWAIQDSSEVTGEGNAILTDIEAGQIDINQARSFWAEEARRQTADGRSVVSKATYDKVANQITQGGRDAVDVFVEEQTGQVTNFLLTQLSLRDAELKVRAQAKTLTSTERRQVSSVGFLLQVNRHQLNLYEEALANRIRTLGIEDTSGKEAKVEAVRMWESIKRKNLTQRINDFVDASGQALVRPEGFPETTWETSDARNRAAIVNGVSKGMSNNEITEMLFR